MTRTHVLALLGGLGVGIGIGLVAILLILNRVETFGVPVVQPAPATAIAPVPQPPAPQAATGVTAKPAHAKLRKPTAATRPGSEATADSRGAAPTIRYPGPVGGDGKIFSGADPNDPRIDHFAD